MAVESEATDIDPHFSTGGIAHYYYNLTHDKLVDYGRDGLLDPSLSLAESWEFADDTTLVFNLRPGVEIQDTGEAVDSELIAYNLERAGSDEATSRSDVRMIDRVEIPGEREVVLHLSEPSAPLLAALADRAGVVVSRENDDQFDIQDVGRNPLGSGMFQLTEWRQDDIKRFVRNDNHWRVDGDEQQLPYLDGIDVRVIPEPTVLVATLEGGDVDIIETPNVDYDRLNANPDLHRSEFPGLGNIQIFINNNSYPLDNEWFRLALAHSMDRDSFDNIFQLGAEPPAGLLTPASWAFNEALEGHRYDPQLVHDYLERSEIPEEDRRLVSQPHTGPDVSDEEQFWAESARELGIPIDFRTDPPLRVGINEHVLANLGADESVPMFFGTFSHRVDPDMSFVQVVDSGGTFNAGGVEFPGVSELMAQGNRTLDDDERREIYQELDRLCVENFYSFSVLSNTMRVVHANTRVGNLERVFDGAAKFRWGELWIGA